VIFKTFSEVFVCAFWKSSAMIFFSVMGSSLMYWGGITQLSKSVRWDGCTHLKHSESQLQSCKKLISSVHAPKGKVLRCYGRNGWKKSWPKPAENLCYSSSTSQSHEQSKPMSERENEVHLQAGEATRVLGSVQRSALRMAGVCYFGRLGNWSHTDEIISLKTNFFQKR